MGTFLILGCLSGNISYIYCYSLNSYDYFPVRKPDLFSDPLSCTYKNFLLPSFIFGCKGSFHRISKVGEDLCAHQVQDPQWILTFYMCWFDFPVEQPAQEVLGRGTRLSARTRLLVLLNSDCFFFICFHMCTQHTDLRLFK